MNLRASLIFLLLLSSCGEEEPCLSLEQVRAICLSDKIEADPTRWKVPQFTEECEDDFPYERCYPISEHIK